MDFLNLIMWATFGDDWTECFDLIVANCKGNLFLKTDNVFYEYNKQEKETLKGKKVPNAESLHSLILNKRFLEGNA